MTKGATEVAASVGDEETVTAEAMLRSLTFQQRLDQARIQRERALQDKGEGELSPATLSKPWEKPAPAHEPADAPPPSRRLERAAPTLFFPAGSAPPPVANLSDAALPTRRADPSPSPGAHRWSVLPKSGLLRTAIGFSLGLGVGLGVAFFTRPPTPAVPTASPASAAAPTTGLASASADQPALAGAATSTLAGLGQPDVPPVTPASAEVSPMPSLAGAPVAAAPETPPNQPMATTVAPPSVWWPEDAGLSSIAGEEAGSIPSLDITIITATRLPPQITAVSVSESVPQYGLEARQPPSAHQPPSADNLPDYARLSVKILGAAATDDPALTTLATTLSDAGFPAADIGQVSYKIRQTHVRYYHSTDSEAAEVIAERLGTSARDFSQTTPQPPEGLIEVWVAPPSGGNAQVAPPAEAKPKPAPGKTAAKKKSAVKKQPKAPAPDVAEDTEAAKVKARILLMLQGSGSP